MQIQTIVDLTIMPFKYLCETNYELIEHTDMPVRMQIFFLVHDFYVLLANIPLKDKQFMEISNSIGNFNTTLTRLRHQYGNIYCTETIIDKKEFFMPLKKDNISVLGGEKFYDFKILDNGFAVLSCHIDTSAK